jgi:hypothetical protein
LYVKLVPAGRLMVANQRGSLLVYFVALRATALLESKLPSCEMLPEM